MQTWGGTSLNSVGHDKESENPFSPAKDLGSIIDSPGQSFNSKLPSSFSTQNINKGKRDNKEEIKEVVV